MNSNNFIGRPTQRPTYSRFLTPTFLSLSPLSLYHIYKTDLSLPKRQMKSFTIKVFILKSTSVSYVRNTLIWLSNIVEKIKNMNANVKKSLHFTIKNQRNFEFSEIKTQKKTYREGRSIKLYFRVRQTTLST